MPDFLRRYQARDTNNDMLESIGSSQARLKPLLKFILVSKTKKQPFLILGNGPSVNSLSENTNLLTQCHVGVCNMYAYYQLEALVSPRYYYFADPAYWDSTKFHGQESLFRLIARDLPATTVVLPKAFENNVRKIAPSIRVFAYNPKPEFPVYQDGFEKKCLIDQAELPGVQTVTHLALFHAILLGYKSIYLIGVEMDDWKNVSGGANGIKAAYFSHYYDDIKPDSSMGTVFGANSTTEHLSNYNYLRLLEDSHRAIKGFYNLAKIAANNGVTVVNLSINSWLDCFPKSSPSQI